MSKIFNEQSFENEVLNQKGIALVDFYADWCSPCKMIAPIIEEIAEERPDVCVGKINVNITTDVAIKYNVISIPTIIVFEDGVERGRIVGYTSKERILELL